MGRFVYNTDYGDVHWTKLDLGNGTASGATAYDGTNAANGRLPKGLTPRRRYMVHPTTGREKSVTCGDVTADMWTAAEGTVQALIDPATALSVNYHLAGRTGERKRS